ncbi:MAG: Pycsar system effector family protein [Ginsengibacter sp.]
MNYELLLNEGAAFISKYVRKHDNPKLLYHNLFHTQNVVAVASQIAKHSSLKEDELFIVNAAAWFLYVGWYKDALHPEEAGAEMASEFFRNAGVENETIESIKKCILGTITGSVPGTLLASIICDADSFYLGTENFSGYNKLKRKEAELLDHPSIDKNEWKRNTIIMLERHEYYTEYCKARLNTTKQQNLNKLKKKNPLLSLTADTIASILEDKVDVNNFDKELEKLKESKTNSADRTIETMFRNTSANSQRLSVQADSKAHILISVNTILIPLVLAVFVAKNNAYPKLPIVPVAMLLLVNLVTIIFSVLATRPNVSERKFSEGDYRDNKVNLLFFGNFFAMNFDTYCNFMLHVMSDKQSLYIIMLRNIYEQGIVLGKKYKMLKIAYNVFMYGLVVSVIAFMVSYMVFQLN